MKSISNNHGKTITIFLFVLSILLLSIMAITVFFFQKEREMRKINEMKLTQAMVDLEKTQNDLLDAKKQAMLSEEKTKQADQQIDALMNDVEVEKGLKEEIKKEKTSLQQKLDEAIKAKETLVTELSTHQQKIADLEEKLKEQEKICQETEKSLSANDFIETPLPSSSLDPATVSPAVVIPIDQIPEGQVLSINQSNNFIVLNRGSQQGITTGLVMSLYHGDKYLGDVQVSRVQTDMSVADILPPLTSKKIRMNDKVVVKK